MTGDARFEDGADTPLRLAAETVEDVPVISALLQDAVFTAADMRWRPRLRRFDVLVNRFRWEDRERAAPERVRSVLTLADVRRVSSQGFDRSDRGLVLSCLSLTWEPGEDCTGRFVLTLAGDGAIAFDAECINAALTDVTRPYVAPSGRAPKHPE
jgi:hypothetical protein